jgi:hypothetical protein
MTPKQIKIILLENDLTIQGLADEFGCRRQELSMCINQRRNYPSLQEKLAERLRKSRIELFGNCLQINAKGNEI